MAWKREWKVSTGTKKPRQQGWAVCQYGAGCGGNVRGNRQLIIDRGTRKTGYAALFQKLEITTHLLSHLESYLLHRTFLYSLFI